MRRRLFALVLAFGLSTPAHAQELSARAKELFTSYKSLVELQDLRGITQLVAKDMRNAKSGTSTEEILDQYTFKFVRGGDPAALDEVRLLATAADEFEQATRFTKRFELVTAFSEEQRTKWLAARLAWNAAIVAFQAANGKKDQPGYRRSIGELDDVAAQAAAVKDLEMESLALYHIGICREELGEYPEVVTTYDKAMDDWLAAGRPKDAFYQHMVDKRRELIEKGHDPLQRDKPAEGAAKKNSTTSYREGTDWQEWTTDYHEMKEPQQFPSSSPWCIDFPLLWREFSWSEGAHAFGALTPSSPFGKQLSLVRDGSKGYFDLDGDKKEGKSDSPCKIIDGKATLNVVKSGEGKEAETYAYFLFSGGQGQTWFQTTMNYTGSGRFRVGCYREGKVLGETVVLLDDNGSGSFGDPNEVRDNILRDNPSFIDNDAIIVGKGRLVPWSDVVQIGDKWHHVKVVDPHGKKLRTRELDVETGQVVLKWNGPVAPKMLVLAEVRDFKGSFFDVAGGKPVTVPAGRYEIAYGRIETGKGAQAKQAWIFKGKCEPVEVKAGETVTLDLGAPYTIDFETDSKSKSVVVRGKSLVVSDKSGAIVGRIYDELPFPEVSARLKGGGALGKPKEMAKISTETLNKDNAAAWFPGDLTIDKSEKQIVEVQLSLKKHGLLGGPFTSEWK